MAFLLQLAWFWPACFCTATLLLLCEIWLILFDFNSILSPNDKHKHCNFTVKPVNYVLFVLSSCVVSANVCSCVCYILCCVKFYKILLLINRFDRNLLAVQGCFTLIFAPNRGIKSPQIPIFAPCRTQSFFLCL